jgi:ribonuclease D
MIQFNNGKNVFLFDIYKITQLTFDFDLFEAVKLAVRRVMLDDSILKIFHDSRHDGLGLHEFMNSCIRNVFDTSGI